MTVGNPLNWSQLLLTHDDQSPIAVIEHNPVESNGLGRAEIDEFLKEVERCQPKSAAMWLRNYLPRVKSIYAIQILPGAQVNDGWSAIHELRFHLQHFVGGIVQADWEGFSNEEGYLILWQLTEHGAVGIWWMAVLREGEWVTFQMDLANPEHRDAFMRGEVPRGITPSRPS